MSATLDELNTALGALKVEVDHLTVDVAKLTPPPTALDLTAQVQQVTEATTAVTAADAAVKTITG